MEADLADRLDGAPELRLASYTYREVFGQPPARVWRVPGTIALLADGPRRLTVTARWGAIVAAGPLPDGIIELMRMNRPDERLRLTVDEAAAGGGPAWAADGLRSARHGAALLVNTDLPEGSGVGATEATQVAIRLALRDLAGPGQPAACPQAGDPGADHSGGHEPGTAMLGHRRLPCDPAAAGLRLAIIDTRVRGTAPPPITEQSPVEAAAAALEAGRIEALGPMLTAAHAALAPDEVQDVAVSAALGAGALGARMIVDSPGRPVLALLPAQLLPEVRTAVSAAFAAGGFRPPRFLTVSPAGGAHRAA
jgi:hypothetical protein